MNPFDLSGSIAVVTGGGRGIGREIALTIAGAGASVAIVEIDPETGVDVASEIRELGRDAMAIEADVRDTARVDHAIEEVVRRFGRVDVVINNAGIAEYAPAEETSDTSWLRMMDINLNGVFRCCRAAARHMLPQRSGVIVNLASMSGCIVNRPQPQAAYNTSKAGVIMLTKCLAAEWASRGVRVNCVSPGYVGTEMTKQGMETAEFKRTWLEMTPMARVGVPAEIARAVWFLASDASSFATGTNLIVDGGYTVW